MGRVPRSLVTSVGARSCHTFLVASGLAHNDAKVMASQTAMELSCALAVAMKRPQGLRPTQYGES